MPAQSLVGAALLCASLIYGQEFRLGSKVTDFHLQDPSGATVSFSKIRGPVTLVTFISTQCPVSNAYNARMRALYNDYNGRVTFVFINANRTESAEEVAQHAKSVGFTFPVYKDFDGDAAARFDAQVTPESYLIDTASTIVYHGQIDDSRNEARVQQRTLRAALNAVLSGKQPPVAETKAFGCTIKRVRKST